MFNQFPGPDVGHAPGQKRRGDSPDGEVFQRLRHQLDGDHADHDSGGGVQRRVEALRRSRQAIRKYRAGEVAETGKQRETDHDPKAAHISSSGSEICRRISGMASLVGLI